MLNTGAGWTESYFITVGLIDSLGISKNVKLPLYRHIAVQDVKASRISRQSAHEGGKVVGHTHWPPLPPREGLSLQYLQQVK
jgi:hypothetical protein